MFSRAPAPILVNFWPFWILIPGLAFSQFDIKDCQSKARNEIEEAYCKIKQEGLGVHLPSLYELRRNPPNMQKLLMKRDLERLGIDLSVSKESAENAQNSTTDNQLKSQTTPQPIEKRAKPTKTTKITKTTQPKKSSKSDVSSQSRMNNQSRQNKQNKNNQTTSLNNCQLEGEAIQCHKQTFTLIKNKRNRDLNESVFKDTNQLNIPSFKGDPKDKKWVNKYLTNAYSIYIDKMLTIGLAESTMSYTKFYYTFENAIEENIDFADRFRVMYTYLKKDKQTIYTAPGLNPIVPTDLKDCEILTKLLIVCDYKNQNLLFQAAKK